jgi:hypothetical protein
MSKTLTYLHGALVAATLALVSMPGKGEEVFDVALKNPTFAEGVDNNGVPVGWSKYAGAGKDQSLEIVDGPEGGKALLIADGDAAAEIGVNQTFPLKESETYRASVQVKAVKGASPAGSYLQFRFLPSNEFAQTGLWSGSTETFLEVSVTATAPAGTKTAMIYLYTHAQPTPRVIVAQVKVVGGVPAPPPPPPPPPPPVPPQYDKLRDLHLQIPLVVDGKPAATLVVPASGEYQAATTAIVQAIEKRTGVKLPIVADDSPAAAVPITGNLVVLGNRSTSKTMSALYDLYYCLADLKYPGPEGYVLRTVHNPFGDGNSVVIVGGSDAVGVTAGAQTFATILAAAPGAKGQLSLGWTMATKLGNGVKVPTDIKEFETWEASKGYGSSGYFGWCSISKRMAMYYMTGDELSAREVVRLSFPDAQALKDIEEIDGERIENKHDPLAGFYHYNAHMAILFWDLIEESPVFTDEERLKITNAFARQLNHRKDEGVYGLTQPPAVVSSRHGQWSAISLYCLGRYFNKSYPNPVWAQCVRGGELAFHSLHQHAWISGESDNLFWYNTGIAPVFTYLTLTGDRKPLENGVVRELLGGQEMLVSGRVPDWALNSADMGFLNKAAYLTGDGRWLTYRERTGVDTGLFRLGQSFWPDGKLQPKMPTDLVGKWSVLRLPKPAWDSRASGLPLDQSFYFGSYRSTSDATGDFVLLDGFNGASRNPYHTFDVLELRLNGQTVLQGYHNQVLTSADGMVEPAVAMDAGLLHSDVVGPMAVAVGEVPTAAYSNWRRTLAQRTGRYALIVDDLTFRTDSRNTKVKTTWQVTGGAWDGKAQAVRIAAAGSPVVLPGWTRFRALDMKCTSKPAAPDSVAMLDSLGIALLRATETGSWIEMPFRLDRETEGEYFVDFLNYVDRGVVRAYVDGKQTGQDYDNYAEGVTEGRLPLGRLKVPPGEHRLRLEVVGNNSGGAKCYVGFAGLTIRPEGAVAPTATAGFELRSCDVQDVSGGGIVTMGWDGAVRKDEHRVAFYLLGQATSESPTPLACARIAGNAAALALPQPALAVVGEYAKMKGELVVLAEDHLHGHALTSAGLENALVSSDVPVDLDWDFTSGVVNVVTESPTTLGLRLAATAKLQAGGQPAKAQLAEGVATLQLPAGRHVLTGAVPATGGEKGLAASLQALLDQGQKQRADALAAAGQQAQPTAPELPTAMTAQVGGQVADMLTRPSAEGTQLCVAEGANIHLLTPDGKEVGTLQTDGKIRVLRWWPEPKLLLAGCVDEKVIAFDESGQRKWVFTSEMDPAVYEAAKTYWFKSAPGHEGIHGLYTGAFDDGKSRCFVGSACTLEILDETGKLVKRTPVFWGPGRMYQLVDAPDGSRNLLISIWPNGSDSLAIVNSKTMTRTGSGYDGVPAGHSYVGGWTAQNRTGLFLDDLDGDGKREVATTINGTWSRVTVYSEEGAPLHNAQFGPGANNAPRAQMRDMDVADLDGDGKKEIVVALAEGLVVALSNECQKLWATRLPSPPVSLKCVVPPGAKAPWIVVSCDDGTVAALDEKGALLRLGKTAGRAWQIAAVETAAGPLAVLATDKGEVKGFRIGG